MTARRPGWLSAAVEDARHEIHAKHTPTRVAHLGIPVTLPLAPADVDELYRRLDAHFIAWAGQDFCTYQSRHNEQGANPMTGRPVDPSGDQPFNPAPRDPGQTAYETRWEGFTLGWYGAAPKWDDLPDDARSVWARVEAASQAAPPAGEKRDPVVEAVRADLLRRSQAGITKYGTMLTRTDIDLRGWVRHALEEVLDLANYLKRTEMELEARAPERPAPTVPTDLPALLRARVEEWFRALYPVTHATRQAEMRATPEWQAADLIDQIAQVTVITVPAEGA